MIPKVKSFKRSRTQQMLNGLSRRARGFQYALMECSVGCTAIRFGFYRRLINRLPLCQVQHIRPVRQTTSCDKYVPNVRARPRLAINRHCAATLSEMGSAKWIEKEDEQRIRTNPVPSIFGAFDIVDFVCLRELLCQQSKR